MRIILVEDEWLQEEFIHKAVRLAFAGRDVSIETISTELAFRERLDEIISNPPDLVIFDIMIRWTDPSEDMDDEPIDIEEKGGLRCHTLLKERAPEIPTLIYSMLKPDDLGKFPPGVCLIQKQDGIDKLLNKIAKKLNLERPVSF
jgi:DNA-binding NarL/FixJ family response regulator